MLIRIWTVNIRADRIADLEHFARTESLPMFQNQAGCLGVLFTRDANLCATISLWEDMKYIDMLKTSPSYNETVEKIVATGMFEGEQSIAIFNCFGGFLDSYDIA